MTGRREHQQEHEAQPVVTTSPRRQPEAKSDEIQQNILSQVLSHAWRGSCLLEWCAPAPRGAA